jgi:hypothetical protein
MYEPAHTLASNIFATLIPALFSAFKAAFFLFSFTFSEYAQPSLFNSEGGRQIAELKPALSKTLEPFCAKVRERKTK